MKGVLTVRVSVTKDERDEWVLMMIDNDLIPADQPFYPDDPSVLGQVSLNKAISSYLREVLAMIEDELPGEKWHP